jgi:hypothetical protein
MDVGGGSSNVFKELCFWDIPPYRLVVKDVSQDRSASTFRLFFFERLTLMIKVPGCLKSMKLFTSWYGVTYQKAWLLKNSAVRISHPAITYSFFRTMILGFPLLYTARSTGNEYLIPFCKTLFRNGIQNLQFKVELLSKKKRPSALRKFLKAREKVTVLEMATVTGKTIHYICFTFCRLCTLGYIKYKARIRLAGRPMHLDVVSDLQFQSNLQTVLCERSPDHQRKIKISQNSVTSVYNVLSSVLYSDIHWIGLSSHVMVLHKNMNKICN